MPLVVLGIQLAPRNNFDPDAKGPATFLLPFLYQPALAQVMRMFWPRSSLDWRGQGYWVGVLAPWALGLGGWVELVLKFFSP